MKPAKFLEKSRSWLSDRWRRLIALETIFLLKRKVSPAPDHREFDLIAYDRYDPAIIDIYHSAGREISEQRARARFSHRLKFYLLTREGSTVAWTWLIPPPRRFIDEAACHFPVPEKATWIRDIFVSPEYRGRRIFTVLLEVLFNRVLGADREIWSDTAGRNQSSLKAHLNAGFEIVDSLKILRLNKLLLARLRRPARIRWIDGYQPGRRVVLTSKAYSRYRDLYLA